MADRTPSARLDLMTDLACVLLSAAGGMLLLVSSVGAQGAGWISGPAPVAFGVDAGIGVLASAMLWFRRRWPVEVAVAMLVPMVLSRSAQLASAVSVFNVSLRRRPATAVAVALAHQVAQWAGGWWSLYPGASNAAVVGKSTRTPPAIRLPGSRPGSPARPPGRLRIECGLVRWFAVQVGNRLDHLVAHAP